MWPSTWTSLSEVGAILVASLALCACAGTAVPDPPACPDDLPEVCLQPAPSYTTKIAPIVASRCLGCHDEGGIAGSRWVLSSYEAVYARRGAVLNQVYTCSMPTPDAEQPSPDERAALLQWLVCSAPNN